MNIIIVGCGKVGASLAERLSAEDHNLVLVDLNQQKVEELSNRFDAMGVVGNGASFNIQQEAGVETADLFIAVTGADELNLLCCLMAKKSGHCQTIARVRNPMYNQEIRFIKEQLGISMIINPELTAAKEILKLLKFPSAIKIDTFAKGRVELLRFRLKPSIGFGGKSIMEVVNRLKTDILICAVEREGDVFIPNGSFILQDNDILSIVGSLENTARFFEQIGLKPKAVKNSLIIGGGTIAHYLTQNLLKIGFRVRIIEQNPARCEYLSEILPGADIINGDASNESLLMEEGLATADSVVALTGMDEENIFLSLGYRHIAYAHIGIPGGQRFPGRETYEKHVLAFQTACPPEEGKLPVFRIVMYAFPGRYGRKIRLGRRFKYIRIIRKRPLYRMYPGFYLFIAVKGEYELDFLPCPDGRAAGRKARRFYLRRRNRRTPQ